MEFACGWSTFQRHVQRHVTCRLDTKPSTECCKSRTVISSQWHNHDQNKQFLKQRSTLFNKPLSRCTRLILILHLNLLWFIMFTINCDQSWLVVINHDWLWSIVKFQPTPTNTVLERSATLILLEKRKYLKVNMILPILYVSLLCKLLTVCTGTSEQCGWILLFLYLWVMYLQQNWTMNTK